MNTPVDDQKLPAGEIMTWEEAVRIRKELLPKVCGNNLTAEERERWHRALKVVVPSVYVND